MNIKRNILNECVIKTHYKILYIWLYLLRVNYKTGNYKTKYELFDQH